MALDVLSHEPLLQGVDMIMKNDTCDRIIATNVVLKEMGVKECQDCSFCENEKDSIVHLFWRCPWINNFWNKLENLLKEKCETAKQV